MSFSNSPVSFFETLFSGLSVPAMLVAENSSVAAVNEAAARLFLMPAGDIIGQRWAGLDANATLVRWKGYWKQMEQGEQLSYSTDIETGRQYMRPINVEARRVCADYALVTLSDRVSKSIAENEIELLARELEVGRWSYNRVDGEFSLSPVCRQLLGLPEGEISKSEIASLVSPKMQKTDFARLRGAAEKLLAEPTEVSMDLVVESPEGTTSFNFVCQSVANELHVTHLYGMLRRSFRTQNAADPSDRHFADIAAFSLQQTEAMIFWSRPDGTLRYANKAVLDKLGYTLEELSAMPIQNYVPAFSEAERQAFWDKLRKTKSIDVDYVLLAADGTEIQTNSVVNYIRFGEEEFSYSITRDLTQRLAEEKRQRLAEFTIDETDDLIVWSRPDGGVYSANNTYLNLTGYDRATLQTLNINDLFREREPFTEDHWDQLRHGKVITSTATLRTQNEAVIPVRAKINYLEHEGEGFGCFFMHDIRQEIEADRLLTLSRLALDTAADCILWLDANYRVTYTNETFKQLLPERLSQRVIGLEVDKVLPALDRQYVTPGNKHDFDFTTRDGDVKHMNLTCSLLTHEGKQYFVLTARDISSLTQEREELKEAYTEIEMMRDRLRDENVSLREENDTKYNVNNIITVSRKYQKILGRVGQVADTDTTVLITGETGTGKELLARAVHQLSAREDFPLIKVNCAALPESLIESELFGHEKGAFTGAISRKKGRFEMADRGTIFLDEIGEMPLDLQAKLLRVLQEDEFERLGGETTIKVDVRMIAATNRDLEDMVRRGKFREDLYYRLNVFPIHNLPLRERPEDIPVLIEYFTKKYAKRQGKLISKINTADINRMKSYAFPGNIRELENIIERSVVLCNSEVLAIDFVRNPKSVSTGTGVFLSFEEMQRKYIIDALKQTGGRMTGPMGAGVLLDLNDRTLVSKIRKLGIEKHEYLV